MIEIVTNKFMNTIVKIPVVKINCHNYCQNTAKAVVKVVTWFS